MPGSCSVPIVNARRTSAQHSQLAPLYRQMKSLQPGRAPQTARPGSRIQRAAVSAGSCRQLARKCCLSRAAVAWMCSRQTACAIRNTSCRLRKHVRVGLSSQWAPLHTQPRELAAPQIPAPRTWLPKTPRARKSPFPPDSHLAPTRTGSKRAMKYAAQDCSSGVDHLAARSRRCPRVIERSSDRRWFRMRHGAQSSSSFSSMLGMPLWIG